jgi:hypothetical protein
MSLRKRSPERGTNKLRERLRPPLSLATNARIWTGARIEYSAAKQTYVNPPSIVIGRLQRISATAAPGQDRTIALLLQSSR